MTDIILAKINEEEMIPLQKKLGHEEFIFICKEKPKRTSGKTAFIAKTIKDIKQKKNFDYIISKPDKWSLADKRIDILYGFESIFKKDHTHYRHSGMNQVIAKHCHDNNVIIAFDLSQLKSEKTRAMVLGRMMQNAKLCRKYKVKTIVATFAKNKMELRSKKDLQAFGRVLGLS